MTEARDEPISLSAAAREIGVNAWDDRDRFERDASGLEIAQPGEHSPGLQQRDHQPSFEVLLDRI